MHGLEDYFNANAKPPTEAVVRGALRFSRRVVVKIGSRSLVDADNRIDDAQIERLVEQVRRLWRPGDINRGEVLVVTSGAVAAGLPTLGLRARPREMPTLQAAAAVGQGALMERYRARFAAHHIPVGQILLTAADLRSRGGCHHIGNTLNELLMRDVVPIINENDSVAVAEMKVGDNDQLSALVAALAGADVLLLLTTAPGLLDLSSEQGGRLVPYVERITSEVRALAGPPTGGGVSVGGMRTKLLAASIATRCGIVVAIADAREPDVIPRLFAEERIGTVFAPSFERLSERRRRIAFFERPKGDLMIDDGAVGSIALGASLLPVGIVRVIGEFGDHETVRIVDRRRVEVGRGVVNYSSTDLRRIAGLRSDRIEAVLGACPCEEAVHRDSMAVHVDAADEEDEAGDA